MSVSVQLPLRIEVQVSADALATWVGTAVKTVVNISTTARKALVICFALSPFLKNVTITNLLNKLSGTFFLGGKSMKKD